MPLQPKEVTLRKLFRRAGAVHAEGLQEGHGLEMDGVGPKMGAGGSCLSPRVPPSACKGEGHPRQGTMAMLAIRSALSYYPKIAKYCFPMYI